MTLPVITVYPDVIPDKGQSQTVFDTNVDSYLTWQTTFATQLTPWITHANTIGAALVAANLPPLTGRALDALRVNAAADGVEFADVTAQGWTFLAAADTAAQRTALEIPAPVFLTQTQAEDDASTVFGQVSGQRLAQAIASVYYDETTYVISTPVASLEILDLGAYNRLEIDSALGYASSGSCVIQVSADNGSTWKTTGYFASVADGVATSGFTSAFPVIRASVSAWSGNAWISNFNTAAVTTFSGTGAGDAGGRVSSGAGSAVEAVAYNAIRIFAAGSLTSGRAVIRGYK
jgi:hypothetical protein